MKIKSINTGIILGFLLSCYSLNQNVVSQQNEVVLSEEVRLTQQQIQLLNALGLRIVVPNYVPPEFKLEKVEAELDHDPLGGGSSYRIIYGKYDADSGKDFCFAIEATNGGIGDLPSGERSFPVNSSVLGKSTLEYGSYGQSSKPTLLGNWLGSENGPFYRFVGAGILPSLSHCDNISPQEAVRVSESLQYLP